MEYTFKRQKTEGKGKYNVFQNVAFLIRLAWTEKRKSILLFIVLWALAGVGSSLLALFVAPTILTAIEDGQPLTEFIMTILWFVIPLILLKVADNYFNPNLNTKVNDMAFIFEKMNLGKFMRTSYENVLKEDLQKKYEQSTSSQGTFMIWYTMSFFIQNVIGFIIYLFILTVFNPLIIGVILITTIASFFIKKHISEWDYRHRDEEAGYHKQMNYILTKTRDSALAKDVRLFGMAHWLEDVYQSGISLFKNFLARSEKANIWADIVDLIFAFLRNGLGYLYLIHLVLNHDLPAASFLLLFTTIGGFTGYVSSVLDGFISLHEYSLGVSMVREFLEYPEPFLFEEGAALTTVVDKKYELELKNVTFAYAGTDVNILENINLKVTAGEKLAIVGLNGAGKTTLVKLICGFLDPTVGEVLLNGVNIKTYNRRDYYQLFAAVFQDFSILPGSISYNIAQDEYSIDSNKVEECATLAGISDAINKLPDRYETNLNKDVYDDAIELSGGQTQRLMLARALYKNGPILVLDEPTAALDPIAESEIYQSYSELTAGRTSIYISHRLASTGFCDRIILLDENRIAEIGTHKELIHAGGKYAKLFEIQGKYYQANIDEDEVMNHE